MADANVWGVIVGGLIGLAGGVTSQTILHRMQAKEREHRLRAEKLEEFAAAALESQVWLDNVRDSKFWGKETTPGVCPISKAYAIATIYFPEMITKVNELQQTVQGHVQWIARAALKKHDNPTGFADDIATTYKPYMDKLNEMIEQINRAAAREFATRNPPPFNRLRKQWEQAIQRVVSASNGFASV